MVVCLNSANYFNVIWVWVKNDATKLLERHNLTVEEQQQSMDTLTKL